MSLEIFSRVPLLDGPTPIQRLAGLERSLGAAAGGVRIFVKRDDVMGIGGGGNKLRKLEFLLGEAVAKGCDTFVTVGGVQSNHARLSAASAARMGLACELVLADVVARGDIEYRRNGNVLLDGIFGATVHYVAGSSDPLEFARKRAAELEGLGRRAYVVGSGGSSPVGCLGYAACAQEIAQQETELGETFARIVIPNGSSGTHAGLAAGFAAMGRDPKQVRSFAVLREAGDARNVTLDEARATLALLDADASLSEDAIDVSNDQRGAGYGIPTQAGLDAIRTLARTEGLLIDPVYGGKAFAGVLADIRAGVYRPGDAVLFIMTGGVPGLFAYRPALDQQKDGEFPFANR
ncbi:MAG: D-cysteine desulfhydrase family protein [Chthoniobacterales bacterium]